ncbi:hypothetical protein ACLKA6_018551 [Drosophila palustris]
MGATLNRRRRGRGRCPFCPSPTSCSTSWSLLLVLALATLLCSDNVESLTMTEIRIPKHIMRHEDAILGCKFDLDGESLYSVKWYKDGFEFYRYVPRDMPPGQVFPLPGVDVENKSKVLQTLEESVPPLSHEDAIEMIAQMVRQPESNPIEVGLRLGRIDKDQSILHMESQKKLHAAMEHFDATPEQLDSVYPVSDKELSELVEASTSLMDDDDDDDDDDDVDDDDEEEG